MSQHAKIQKPNTTEQVLEFVRTSGLVRPRDVADAGFPTALLYRLRDRGQVLEDAPGLFMHPDLAVSEKHAYARASKLVPGGVLCLLSALAFHGIGTQLPGAVWMALRAHSQRPRSPGFPLEVVWFSGEAFSEGQRKQRVEGADVRVYSPAKTVADLFRYRNKLGVDIAIEALTESWRQRLFDMDELLSYARICRVATVMRPHLQSLTVGH